MKTYFDCIPCFVRQTLDSVRLITDDEKIQEEVMRQALCLGCKMDLRQSPPAMAQNIHRLIRELTENPDPYHEIKQQFNKLALDLYPELKKRIEDSDNPFETAVRLAIAGNIIDFGVKAELEESCVKETIEKSLVGDLDLNAVVELKSAIERAEDILYIGDNAGEIVFDRLLIEQLPAEKITFVVKAAPIINDATLEDAEMAGLTELVEVIDNGNDAPGTILADGSELFRKRFKKADLIIAKGQGNYETLSEADGNIFFILKAKCPVIARHLDCNIGDMILVKNEVGICNE